MTDDRPVLDVIAEALAREVCVSFTNDDGDDDAAFGVVDASDRRLLAARVLAACHEATAKQQAALTKGEVEQRAFTEGGYPCSPLPPGAVWADRTGATFESRAVGPWRKDPS